MKKLLLSILILTCYSSIRAADILVHEGDNLQTALTAAACGDNVVIDAQTSGHQSVFTGSFTLANKSCTISTPITIKSSATASLPSGRVGATNVISDTNPHSIYMPRIRTTGGGTYGAVFETAANAGWWIIDGLDLTDNAADSANISALLDLGNAAGGAHDIVVQRCWIHQKETGTNYNRSIQRAVWAEGSNITVKWNYIYIIGYYYPVITGGDSTYQMDTCAFLSVGGPGPFTITDNFISVWWNTMFLGGGDSAAQHFATLSGSPSTTSATFSITPPPAGTMVRFSVEGTATKSGGAVANPNLVRLTGAVLTSQDGIHGSNTGTAIKLTSVDDPTKFGVASLATVSGDNWTTASAQSIVATIPDGEVTWELYEVARMDSVVSSVGNYTPVGVDELRHAPSKAAWCVGDEGQIIDVSLTKNTIRISAAFAEAVFVAKGYAPKGWIEIKSAKRLIIEGNYFLEYPSNLVIYSNNQLGTAPWTTTSDIYIRNNFFNSDGGHSESIRGMGIINSGSYLHNITPTNNVVVYNNLIKNLRSFMQLEQANSLTATHNTNINTEATAFGYNALVTGVGIELDYIFKDNIGSYVVYGMQCQVDPFTLSTCYPSGVFLKNVVVDDASQGVSTSQWGANSILSPVASTFDDIGFVNAASNNYRLAGGSPYKNAASDGGDPGVIYSTLTSALGFDPSASTVVCNWHTSPVCN